MKPEIPALTTAQIREVDRLMVEEYGIQLVQMMENAGRHLAALTRTLLGGAAGKRILVSCGTGSNGGGGLVAARHLANWGAAVTVLAESERRLAEVPARQWTALRRLPVRRMQGDAAVVGVAAQPADLIVDALVGYGLQGNPRGWTARMIEQMNGAETPVLALDVPSGLDATSGVPATPCVNATATMTLALPKTGLLTATGRPFVGALFLADIGVPPGLYRALGLELGPIFATSEVLPLEPR